MSDQGEQGEQGEQPAEDPRGDLRWGSIPGLVADAAARFGDAEAVVDGEVRLTFAQLEGEALRVTAAAMAAGIHPGDRVAIWAPNMAEWIVAALGLVGAGAALVPLNTRFKGPEAAYVLTRSRARALFTVRGFLGIDYPALLDDEDVPDLERIVLLRDDEGTTSEVTKSDEVPIFGWHEFLAAADGVVEGEEGVVGAAVDGRAVRERWASVTGEDLSDVIFTSGTTGRPKGAMTTHAQTLRTFATWASIVGLAEGDRYLVVNPFFHTFGYKAGIIACLMQGATIVPEPVFDVDKVLEAVAAQRITVLPGPPTLYQSILDHPRRAEHDLSSLRLAVTGAAVVPVELVKRMRSELTFSTVLTAYGLTESTGTVTMCRQGDDPETIASTSGRAIPGLEVRVVDDKGKELDRGEPGEIVVRGYTVVRGYFEDPEATAQAIDAQGWLHTGDVGIMDDAGNVRITDRKKDMFIVGGFNAYPAEIEGALARHPGVAQAAVIGVPDARMGEVGCAFVVPRSGTDAAGLAEELLAWSREQMANYKVPRHVEVTDALPTNASGKVLKTELRERFAQRPAKGA
ncbi:MAG TPA: FadD3 family acyl-CoA ligase [Acidimicrobiales bacterium]|nr:FadD3 family acyl-CoA ligase [Acidimicrobiales bacterium]